MLVIIQAPSTQTSWYSRTSMGALRRPMPRSRYRTTSSSSLVAKAAGRYVCRYTYTAVHMSQNVPKTTSWHTTFQQIEIERRVRLRRITTATRRNRKPKKKKKKKHQGRKSNKEKGNNKNNSDNQTNSENDTNNNQQQEYDEGQNNEDT